VAKEEQRRKDEDTNESRGHKGRYIYKIKEDIYEA